MARLTRVTRTVRRVVDAGRLGEVVVELGSGSITVRPLRSRKPYVEVTYEGLVTSVLLARQPRKKKGGRR